MWEVVENLDDLVSYLGLSPRAAQALKDASMAVMQGEMMCGTGGDAMRISQPMSTSKDVVSPPAKRGSPMQQEMSADLFDRRQGAPDDPCTPPALVRQQTADFFDRQERQQPPAGAPAAPAAAAATAHLADSWATLPSAVQALMVASIPAPMDPMFHFSHASWTTGDMVDWASIQWGPFHHHQQPEMQRSSAARAPLVTPGDVAPALHRRFEVSDTGWSSYHVEWTLKSDILTSANAVHVSPSFDLSFDGEVVQFRLVLTPRESDSFCESGGVGKIELKCEDAISASHAWVHFELAVGQGDRLLPSRGLVCHDFAQSAVGGLKAPADQWWDFQSSVDAESRAFVVTCSVVSQVAADAAAAGSADPVVTGSAKGAAVEDAATWPASDSAQCTPESEDQDAGRGKANRCRSAEGRQKQLERWRMRRQTHRMRMRGGVEPVPESMATVEERGAAPESGDNAVEV